MRKFFFYSVQYAGLTNTANIKLLNKKKLKFGKTLTICFFGRLIDTNPYDLVPQPRWRGGQLDIKKLQLQQTKNTEKSRLLQ